MLSLVAKYNLYAAGGFISKRALATGSTKLLQRVVFLGPPGSGKGTYCKLVAPEFGLQHISTGDIIRDAIKAKTEQGTQAAAYSKQGLLVPDALLMDIITPTLNEAAEEGGFILDGFPRTVPQAELLDSILPVNKVVRITMREDAIKAKLLGRRTCPECGKSFNVADVNEDKGTFLMPAILPTNADCLKKKCVDRFESRADDTAAVVEERLRVYHHETEPLVGFYRKRGVLMDVEIRGGEKVMLPVFRSVMASPTKAQ